MRTLYIRNVPDDVAAALEDLAEDAGTSLNAFVVAQFSSLVQRSRNAALLAALPSLDTDPKEIVAAIHAGRRKRERQVERALGRRARP